MRTLERKIIKMTKGELMLLLPLLLLMGTCFLYSIIYGIESSFGYNRIVGEDSFTLDFYRQLFSSRDFKASFIYTARLTVLSSLISIGFSILVLYYAYANIQMKFFTSRLFSKVIESPLLVPYLIGTYMILALLSQRGLISQGLLRGGVITSYEAFPVMTNDRGGIGMIVTYVWKTSAFIIAMSMGTLVKVEKKWRDLKKILNLKESQFFCSVILPILAPGLLTSFIVIFTYIFTSFETPYILGVTFPKTLSLYAYELSVRGAINLRGVLMALNMVIALSSVILGTLAYKLAGKFIKNHGVGWE